MLGLFLLSSFWVLFLALEKAGSQHLTWTGTDTTNTYDQMQYLAWIRDSSRHLLVSNLFVSQPTAHDYLEPLVVVAGLLVRLGAAPWLALIVFQPVAVVLLFLAVRAYAREALGTGWRYRGALVLALFFGVPGDVVHDTWIPFLSWGYVPALFAIAGLTAAVVCYDRAARGMCRAGIPALLGLGIAWLHPWQGEELILIVILTEVARRVWGLDAAAGAGGGPAPVSAVKRLGLPALVIGATALPLIYVLLLSRLDPTWRAAESAGQVLRSPAALLAALALLLIAAAFAWFRRPTTILGASTRAWGICAFVVCGLCYAGLGNNPVHALSGITIPLALLAVEGAGRIRIADARTRARLGTAAVALATVPVMIYMLIWVPVGFNNYTKALIRPGEARAIRYLAAQPGQGAVFTTLELGSIVPEATGRRTYLGDWAWSVPRFEARSTTAMRFFYRPLTKSGAERFLRRIGVVYVLSPCGAHRDVGHALGPLVKSTRHFGCAALYTLRES